MIWILLFGIAMIASVAHALYDERKKRRQAAESEDPIWEYARHLGDGYAVRAAARKKEIGE